MLATLASGGSDASDENFVSFHVEPWIWAAFVALVVVLLLADLFLFHREAHVISTREAAVESTIWIAIGLSFSLVFLFWQGGDAAGEYLAGYLIEKSLSVDNVFVWALILGYFAVPRQYQHRALFWGIFGALVLRAIFIFAGVALLEAFDWIIYVFGGILIFTAIRLLLQDDEEVHPDQNPVLKLVRRVIPSTSEYHGQKLFWKDPKTLKRLATPLLAVLVVIETSDVIFAVDSIPAILAVAREPFIVFTSNAFAILGLRALYFLLADLKDRFEYLQEGLAVILIFVGVKMVISNWYHIPTVLSLGVIALILTISILVSLKMADDSEDDPSAEGPVDTPDELAS